MKARQLTILQMKNDNEIDQLFKKGLSQPDIPFDELHWEKMEEKLGSEPKKRVIPLWVLSVSGIAAALLIAMFLLLNKDQSKPVYKSDELHADHVKPKGQEETVKNSSMEPNSSIGQNGSAEPKQVNRSAQKHVAGVTDMPEDPVVETGPLTIATADAVQVKPSPIEAANQPALIAETKAIVPAENTTPAVVSNPKKLPVMGKSPFSLSIIAAPDISSSQDHVSAKVSTNVGLLATYSITEKLSITTGAIYARKLYDYAGMSASNYGNPGKAWEVDADCKVLDIPLNVNYKVFSKGSNAITLNTGVSSYFMLNEKYKYINSDGAGGTKISNLEFVNRNQHLAGVANLSVSFNRQVSSQLNIGIQPFIKIPLTGIGYHDSKLRSTGVAFSLNFNLPKSSGDK
ncbi:MAG: hypothetical protein V4687_00765 [Bacteroidota bacterium]